jgi:membrane protease YdiL (CAAX protease family)
MVVVLAAGRRRGLEARELGFHMTRRGLAITAGAAGVAAALVGVADTAGALSDASVGQLTPGEAWFRLLIGIPIGTAVCEEVIFRGVVLCPLRRWSGDLAAPVAVHAVVNAGVFAAVLVASRG